MRPVDDYVTNKTAMNIVVHGGGSPAFRLARVREKLPAIKPKLKKTELDKKQFGFLPQNISWSQEPQPSVALVSRAR